jgi:hypothetical protein
MNQLFNIFVEILGIAMLSSAFIWEVWNDKDGDAHISRVGWNAHIALLSKRIDIYARCVLAAAASMLNIYVTHHNVIASMILAGAIHFMFFDYTIHYFLYKNGVIADRRWWSYLGSKGTIDNAEWWRNKSWGVRLAIKVAVFIIACVIYF